MSDFENQVAKLKKEISLLEKRLAMSNAAFLNIVGNSLDGIVIMDRSKMVVYANYAALNLFDKNLADLLGEPLELNCDPENNSEVTIQKQDGTVTNVEVSLLETEWNSEPSFLASFRDVTERKKSEDMLKYISRHDFLTDLPNRSYFEQKLLAATKQMQEDEFIGLLYIDLDNFKLVNDTLGHSAGDALLREIAKILKTNIRKHDTAARLGGDEFAIILTALRKPEYASIVAQNILKEIEKPIKLDQNSILPNASIGVAIYPVCSDSIEGLVKNADTAMYAAKKSGKNQFKAYLPSMDHQNSTIELIISKLKTAVDELRFELYYQPIADAETLECVGCEALIRWQDDALGMISPDNFLPLAVQLGYMRQVSNWVVEQALKDLRDMPTDIWCSINLTANDIHSYSLLEHVSQLINQYDADTSRLKIELTESCIINQPEKTISNLQKLNNMGIQICIDDFGSGYSSLNYLKILPISNLKIDREFIKDINLDLNDTIIVKSTIKLAHNLKLSITAEGVESFEQIKFLQQQGCNYLQGFYFSRALPIEDFLGYLQTP